MGTPAGRPPDEVLLAGPGAGGAGLAAAFVRRLQQPVFGVALTVIANGTAAEDSSQQPFEQAWAGGCLRRRPER